MKKIREIQEQIKLPGPRRTAENNEQGSRGARASVLEKEARGSTSKSHLFIIKGIYEVYREIVGWKNVKGFLIEIFKQSLDSSINNYVIYCWQKALVHCLTEVKMDGRGKEDIMNEYKKRFMDFGKIFEDILRNHKKYVEMLSGEIKDMLRVTHVKFIYPRYHQFLNKFLEWKVDMDKSQCVLFYANDLEKRLKDEFLV